MLSDFEDRLADVLGSRLTTPLAGRVRRRGEPDPAGAGPVVEVGVDAVEPLEPDFGSVRPEIVPGSADHRRVVRLAVTVGIEVRAVGAQTRLQRLAGLDAVLYELQEPDLRTGTALVTAGDQGFLVERLRLLASDLSSEGGLAVEAVGWFWPPGVAGATGVPVQRALVRQFLLPVRLGFEGAVEAGGDGVSLDLSFGDVGTLDVSDGPTTAADLGTVALRLLDPGGGPGAGSLAGGSAGPDGSHVVPVAGDGASVTYQPPATAVTDHLVVATHARDADGHERVGLELARFEVVVQP